jgi:hypothetical protein
MKAKYYPHVTLLIAGTLSVCPVALMAIYQGIRTNTPAGSDVIADFTVSPPLQDSAIASSLSENTTTRGAHRDEIPDRSHRDPDSIAAANPTTTPSTQNNADLSEERSPAQVVTETATAANESGSTPPSPIVNEPIGDEPPLHLPSLSSLYASNTPSTTDSETVSDAASESSSDITMADTKTHPDTDTDIVEPATHSVQHPRQPARHKTGDTRRSKSSEKKQDEMPAEPAVPKMRIASLDPRGQLSGLPALPAAADRTSHAQVREDPAVLEEVVIQTPREGHPVAQIEDVMAGTNARGWPVVLVRSDLPDDLWWVQQGVGIQRNTFAARVNFGNTRSLSGTSYRLVVVFLDSQDEMMRFRLARQFKELPEGLRRSREFRYTRN